MTANDSTPGEGERASGDSCTDQQRLAHQFAETWDRLRLSFLEAGIEIEEETVDEETVDELRAEIAEATEVVDDLEEFVEQDEEA